MNNQIQLTFPFRDPPFIPTGKHLKDKGIKKAATHAEKENNGWSERALSFLEDYCRSHHRFSGEMVRVESKMKIPEPCSLRAWGSILLTGSRKGWIEQVDNDLDGYCAGFWVSLNVGIKPNADGKVHHKTSSINYNQKFPFEEIEKDEQVWIVDYSIEPSEMLKLLEITKDVTWIDHHKTAIEKYNGFPHEIRGVRKDGEAGCVLTFKYIHWWTSRGDGFCNRKIAVWSGNQDI